MIVHGSDADLILAAARLMLAANIGSSVPLAQTEDGEVCRFDFQFWWTYT
jgi:hypothetical protein